MERDELIELVDELIEGLQGLAELLQRAEYDTTLVEDSIEELREAICNKP